MWAFDLDGIIPACKDLEDRLIRLLWRSRPPALAGTGTTGSPAGSASVSLSGHGAGAGIGAAETPASASVNSGRRGLLGLSTMTSSSTGMMMGGGMHPPVSPAVTPSVLLSSDLEKGGSLSGLAVLDKDGDDSSSEMGDGYDEEGDELDALDDAELEEKAKHISSGSAAGAQLGRRRWWLFGKRSAGRGSGLSAIDRKRLERIERRIRDRERPARMFAPVYNGLAAALSACTSSLLTNLNHSFFNSIVLQTSWRVV